MKIAIVVSSPWVINSFLYDQIAHLSKLHEVTVITNIIVPIKKMSPKNNVVIKHVKISRKISLFNDLYALYKLLILFGGGKFDLVYSVTPKAGLLAMMAGFLVRIRCRIHIFTGQVWVTCTGIKRLLLKVSDILLARLATHLLADSASQRQFLIDEHVVDSDKIRVIANGSISGVDLSRFQKNLKVRTKIREELNIEEGDLVFLFIGRLNPDKGIFDLADAFMQISNEHNNVKLVIVGPDEADICDQILLKMASKSENLRLVPYTEHPEHYMNAADVLCMPSHREGFGSVVIEAASVGIPAIGSDIYGIRDAIENGETGILFSVKNVQALYFIMKKLIIESDVRLEFGVAARRRAERLFSQEFVTLSYVEYFERVVENSAVIRR